MMADQQKSLQFFPLENPTTPIQFQTYPNQDQSSSKVTLTTSFVKTPKKPKVVIAVPTRGNLCLELVRWLIAEQKKVSSGLADYEIVIALSKGGHQNPNNNGLAKHCLENYDFDYYLKIDDDLVPDSDLIPRLLRMNKDIVGVAVAIWRESIPGIFICCLNIDLVTKKFYLVDIQNHKQGRCNYVGGGLMMIKRHVLERMKQPIWKIDLNETGDFDKGSDQRFCEIATELGFEIWYDATKIIGQHTDLVVTGDYDKNTGMTCVDVSLMGKNDSANNIHSGS